MRLEIFEKDALTEIKPPGAGYRIPYFTLDGKVRPELYRYRFLEDTRTGFAKASLGKSRRYSQPADTPPAVYWPPFIQWTEILHDNKVPLLITEGEKKSAVATKLGLPCLGLGGVWSFRSKKLGVSLLPDLEEIDWNGRTIFITYDSDAVYNSDVCRAEIALADILVDRGAQAKLIRLPELVEGEKCGLDDYLVHEGVDRFMALVEATELYAYGKELHRMNSEVLYIEDPGIVYVRASSQSVRPGDFTAHRYAHWKYTRQNVDSKGSVKIEQRKTAADWLQWEARASVKKFVFAPAEEEITPNRELNLWRGWPYMPVRRSVTLWTQLLNFIFRTDEAARKYVEQWAAYPIQYPGTKLRNAVAVWGVRKGTGKSLLGYTLGDLYGSAFAEIDESFLDGTKQFNAWAREKHFVMGDEISGEDSRRVATRLRAMITREKIEINLKNIPQYVIDDCINYYFTSNSPDCFYLDEDDRRILVHEVRGAPLSDDFYKTFNDWRRTDEGREALMYHLRYEVDTSDFNPMSRPPETLGKLEMFAATRTELESWLINARDFPDLICDKLGKSDLVTLNELSILYEAEGYKRPSPNLIARKLKELGVDPVYATDLPIGRAQIFANGKLQRFYALRQPEKWQKKTQEQLRLEYERARGITKRVKF